ncbi:MAG TPA: Mur ligase family protein, partial [Trebonia sp.]|nr:Mur ligase family protein [Trebonia sp.]
ELAEARRRGLRVLHRSAALASLMAGRRVVAVTGTHGKTTVTSMIATVLLETGAGPAYAIGGVLAATGTGAADGPGRDFVAEADESDGSFLVYAPDVAVVTNIEADHLDNYGTEQAYRASFGKFAGRIRPGGVLVASADDPGTRELAAAARASGLRVVTFGTAADAGYQVANVAASGMSTSLTIRCPADNSMKRASAAGRGQETVPGASRPRSFGVVEFDLRLGVPGHHNALNAAAAFTAAVELGVDPDAAAAALAGFRGTARRLEPKGEAGGVRVLDTYAHHPTELAADLRAARDIVGRGTAGSAGTAGAETGSPGRVIAVFQPHLYSRTRIFAAEFGAALGLADEAVVLDVYAAREDPEPGVTGRLVADAVPRDPGSGSPGSGSPGSGCTVHYVPDFADVPKLVAALAAPGDLVLTMGAGDITRMGPLVLAEIAGQAAV